jgi:hypothetical protein
MKKADILTIFSILVFLLPFAVFGLNVDTIQDLLTTEALSGQALMYSTVGILATYFIYVIFRATYTEKKRKPYVWASLLSLLVFLLFMMIFIVGILGVISATPFILTSSIIGQVISVILVAMSLFCLSCDIELYSVKKNTPISTAYKDSLKDCTVAASVFSLILILASFATSLIINDWTSILITIAVLSVWNSIYYILIRPHLILRIISWRFNRK